jgi:hypothetical protein
MARLNGNVTSLEHFDEIFHFAAFRVNARYNPFQIRQTLGNIDKVNLEGGVVQEILNGIESVMN